MSGPSGAPDRPPTQRSGWTAPLRLLRALATWVVALILIFEEWGWEPLSRALGWIARLPILAWVERRVAALPPYAALPVLALPAALLLPFKLAALWLMGQGHVVLGIAVLVLAKIVGTAVVARLFQLTKPQLLKLAWFATGYARWVAWKTDLVERVRASAPWRAARAFKAGVRAAWRRWRAGRRV